MREITRRGWFATLLAPLFSPFVAKSSQKEHICANETQSQAIPPITNQTLIMPSEPPDSSCDCHAYLYEFSTGKLLYASHWKSKNASQNLASSSSIVEHIGNR